MIGYGAAGRWISDQLPQGDRRRGVPVESWPAQTRRFFAYPRVRSRHRRKSPVEGWGKYRRSFRPIQSQYGCHAERSEASAVVLPNFCICGDPPAWNRLRRVRASARTSGHRNQPGFSPRGTNSAQRSGSAAIDSQLLTACHLERRSPQRPESKDLQLFLEGSPFPRSLG